MFCVIKLFIIINEGVVIVVIFDKEVIIGLKNVVIIVRLIIIIFVNLVLLFVVIFVDDLIVVVVGFVLKIEFVVLLIVFVINVLLKCFFVLFVIKFVCLIKLSNVFVVLNKSISKNENIMLYNLYLIIFEKVLIGFEMMIFFGKWGIVIILLVNFNCFVKKVIIFVIIILINNVLFICNVINIVVNIKLIKVKIIVGEWKLLIVIKLDGWFMIILERCNLIKVINSLILFVIVCFKLLGIVKINFCLNEVKDNKRKIIFVINIVEKVIIYVIFFVFCIIE